MSLSESDSQQPRGWEGQDGRGTADSRAGFPSQQLQDLKNVEELTPQEDVQTKGDKLDLQRPVCFHWHLGTPRTVRVLGVAEGGAHRHPGRKGPHPQEGEIRA